MRELIARALMKISLETAVLIRTNSVRAAAWPGVRTIPPKWAGGIVYADGSRNEGMAILLTGAHYDTQSEALYAMDKAIEEIRSRQIPCA